MMKANVSCGKVWEVIERRIATRLPNPGRWDKGLSQIQTNLHDCRVPRSLPVFGKGRVAGPTFAVLAKVGTHAACVGIFILALPH